MLKRLRHLRGVFADYTLGTVIVMVHMATVERNNRPRLSAWVP